MEFKSFKTESIEIDEREVSGIAAVAGVVDSGNDLIHKGAFKKTLQESVDNVKHLWQHNFQQPPIATIVELREVSKSELPSELKSRHPEATGGLLVKRRYLETQRAGEVLAGIKGGAITQMSFGYDAVKFDYEEQESKRMVRNLREIRLWDTSDVVWGMNQATVARVKAYVPAADICELSQKQDFTRPVLADFTDAPWEELDADEKRRIADHFAYVKDLDSFDGLMFPHHEPSKSGVGAVNLAALNATVDSMFEDVSLYPAHKDIFEHLTKHYENFDQEPPNYTLKRLLHDAKFYINEGIEVEGVSEKLAEILDILQAEPPDDALTLKAQSEKLLLKFQLLEKTIQLEGVI